MKEILLRELFRNTAQYADKEVLIKGWVRNNRSSNKFGFIELNDGSFFKSVQVVYEEEFLDMFKEDSEKSKNRNRYETRKAKKHKKDYYEDFEDDWN